MTLTLSKLSAQNAQATIAREFGGFFGDVALRRALAAEHIRSALYAHASLAHESNLPPTLHTTRISTSVRKALDLLWPGVATQHLRDSDLVQETLESLGKLGDVVHTGGGYWLGTPLRTIRGSDSALVLGAAPNIVVKAELGASPLCAGISRFSTTPSKQSLDRAISVPDWMGKIQDLANWTKSVLSQHETRMQLGNDIPADQLEIYAPDFQANTWANPWVPAQNINKPIAGARLCRPIKAVSYVWERPFYLSHFRFSGGELLITRSVRIEFSLTRRLRFGLSDLYQSPQKVICAGNGDLIELELPLGLPDPEARIAALGWPLQSNPRRTVFHRLAIPFITEVMGRLGVLFIIK